MTGRDCARLVLCTRVTRSTRSELEHALGLLGGPHIHVVGIALADIGGGESDATPMICPHASRGPRGRLRHLAAAAPAPGIGRAQRSILIQGSDAAVTMWL